MANTYTLISSNVLSSSAASVTFSAIPSTYTDLVLRSSVRSTYASAYDALVVSINGTSANNSYTWILGSGASAVSGRDQYGANRAYLGSVNGSTSTSNTFASSEWYLSNYAGSTNKTSSAASAFENNISSGDVYVGAIANLYSNTTAITSLTAKAYFGNLASGSSFYLYGIKNS